MVKMTALPGGRRLRLNRGLIAFLLLWVLVGPTLAAEASVGEAESVPRTKRFIVLIVEGLANKEVAASTTPNIKGLGAAGVRVERVAGVVPDTTVAAVVSVLTGATPTRHGVASLGGSPRVATLFSLLAQREAATALFVTG